MIKIFLLSAFILATGTMSAQQAKKQDVMTKDKGTYVINTSTICDAKGFKGHVPLTVTVKKDKIVKVEAAANQETPKYFKMVQDGMLPKYAGLKFDKYETVDGVTGATFSSKAVKANMKAAYEYYKAHK